MITKQGLETFQQCSRLPENKYWDFEDNFIKNLNTVIQREYKK